MTGFVSCLPDSNNRQQSTTNDNKALQQRQGIELKTTDYNLRKRDALTISTPASILTPCTPSISSSLSTPQPYSYVNHQLLYQTPHPYSYVNHHLHYQNHTLTPTSITISTINTTPLFLRQSPSSLPTPQPYSYVNHHLL